jgi:MFS family permease
MFDCLDQQLFMLARRPAIIELKGLAPTDAGVEHFTTLATAILLIGWATGGIIFGIMGDRLGRARTMVWTILMYSVFTGLSGLAFSITDFLLYRFLAGLGVGGQFAVGVSLVAEVMPDRARPHALGLLQALSALGNIAAALINMAFGALVTGTSAWRWIFAVGILPAFLAVVVMSRLKEPERWRKAVAEGPNRRKAGSLAEMFGTPLWRRRAIIGMLLASSGVIGLWAIGFFSIDLNQSVFRKKYYAEARHNGETQWDRQLVRLALASPANLEAVKTAPLPPQQLIGPDEGLQDPHRLLAAAFEVSKTQTATVEAVLDALDQPADNRPAQSQPDRRRRAEYLRCDVPVGETIDGLVQRITERNSRIGGAVSFWASITSMLFNIGAFFGIYSFSRITHYLGRKPTFAMAFTAAMISTATAFLFMKTPADIFWMVPLMGFCQLSIFGGYAIYFPELFPTRLRSTGTSLCYNIARYFAATGPLGLGLLTSTVFVGFDEPLRYAGVAMCGVFLLGLAVLPFAPETKGLPLPE